MSEGNGRTDGPETQSSLHGYDRQGHETVDPATTMLTDYSVSVRRRDLAAAAAAFDG